MVKLIGGCAKGYDMNNNPAMINMCRDPADYSNVRNIIRLVSDKLIDAPFIIIKPHRNYNYLQISIYDIPSNFKSAHHNRMYIPSIFTILVRFKIS